MILVNAKKGLVPMEPTPLLFFITNSIIILKFKV